MKQKKYAKKDTEIAATALKGCGTQRSNND
jgi:hypothetical protein